MFLLKIFYFLKGYAIISIKGTGAARFVNILRARGVPVWNADVGHASVFARDLDAAAGAAKKAGVQVEVLRLCSLRDVFFRRSGWVFALCAAIFMLFWAISAGYVWSIETEGADADTAAQVLAAAERFGLRVGARKRDLPDGDGMRDGIIYNVDGVAWAWVYLEGTHARICVMEKTAPPVIVSDTEPCSIVAAHDGILYFVSAKSGRALMSKGDRVSAGEVVISGEMPEGEKSPAWRTRASGEVYAETVHTASCEYPLYRTKTRDTGRSVTRRWLRLFELELPLYVKAAPGFSEYRTELSTPPAGICSVKYIETETEREQLPEDTAVREAQDALEEKIAAELLPGSRKTDERVTAERVSDESIKVTLSMSFIENIGRAAPIGTEEDLSK